jgi:hypothetical protein
MSAMQLVDTDRTTNEADELNAARPPAFNIATASHALLPVASMVSDENFSSGMRVKSPTIRTLGKAVAPFSPESGNFSTVPAGHWVCSQCV